MKLNLKQNGYFLVKDAISEDSISSFATELSIFDKDMNHYPRIRS